MLSAAARTGCGPAAGGSWRCRKTALGPPTLWTLISSSSLDCASSLLRGQAGRGQAGQAGSASRLGRRRGPAPSRQARRRPCARGGSGGGPGPAHPSARVAFSCSLVHWSVICCSSLRQRRRRRSAAAAPRRRRPLGPDAGLRIVAGPRAHLSLAATAVLRVVTSRWACRRAGAGGQRRAGQLPEAKGGRRGWRGCRGCRDGATHRLDRLLLDLEVVLEPAAGRRWSPQLSRRARPAGPAAGGQARPLLRGGPQPAAPPGDLKAQGAGAGSCSAARADCAHRGALRAAAAAVRFSREHTPPRGIPGERCRGLPACVTRSPPASPADAARAARSWLLAARLGSYGLGPRCGIGRRHSPRAVALFPGKPLAMD
jgi:hypothetical protein